MRHSDFWFAYVLVFIAQLLLSNYVSFSPYITATVLPAMVLCLPGSISAIPAMLIAFATGLGADFLSEGIIGINALALVPVAFARVHIMSAILGPDAFMRNKSFSFRRNGFGPVTMATGISLAIFLIVYIWADSAGTRSFGFNLAKFFASFAISLIFCLLSVRAMTDSR